MASLSNLSMAPAVGATWGPFGQSVYKDPAGSFIMTVTGPALDLNVFKVFNSGFGTDFKKLTLPLTAAAAVPQDACSVLTNAAAVKGKVVLVDRGTCLFSVKVGLRFFLGYGGFASRQLSRWLCVS